MLPIPATFAGVAVGSSAEHDLLFPSDVGNSYEAAITLAPRFADTPIYEGLTPQPRVLGFEVLQGAATPGSYAQWVSDVAGLFSPLRGKVAMTATFLGLTLTVDVIVRRFASPPNMVGVYRGEMVIPDPVWRDVTINTDAVSPLTVGGNWPALPTLTVTGTTIAITSSSVANPTTITAPSHGLATGNRINVSGHVGSTPAISGEYQVTVTGANTFTIPVNVTVGGTGGTFTRVIRHASTVVTDNTANGLDNHPFRITIDGTGCNATAATNYIVFVNEQSVLFAIQGMNTATCLIDFDVSIKASGTVTVDVYYDSSLNNTLTANKYDDGGRDLANASYTNTLWLWRETNGTFGGKTVYSTFELSRTVRKVGSWALAKLATIISGINWGYVPGTTAIFAVGPQNGAGATLKNDADGVILTTQVEIATGNALKEIDFTSTITASSQLNVEYRGRDDIVWKAAGGSNVAGWDCPGGVQVRAYIVPTASDANGQITVAPHAGGAQINLALDATKVPTASAVTYTAARLIDGDLTNTTTGDVIHFQGVYAEDVPLTIVCTTPASELPSSGRMMGTILPTNPHGYMPLPVGANNWTQPAGVTVSFGWQNRYVV